MTTDFQRQRDALDAFRLSHDLSWLELSTAMARAKFPMSPRTLHHLIKVADRTARPLDRTRYKIEGFLKAAAAGKVETNGRPPRVRRPNRRPATKRGRRASA